MWLGAETFFNLSPRSDFISVVASGFLSWSLCAPESKRKSPTAKVEQLPPGLTLDSYMVDGMPQFFQEIAAGQPGDSAAEYGNALFFRLTSHDDFRRAGLDPNIYKSLCCPDISFR